MKVNLIIRNFGYHFGMIVFVLSETILYFVILLLIFEYSVSFLSNKVDGKAINLSVSSIFIAAVITIILYYVITVVLTYVIIKLKRIKISLNAVEYAARTHKAFGAIYFISALGSSLVVGVFAPDYNPSDSEKTFIFALTVFAALHYLITDIINGYFGVSLIKRIRKKGINEDYLA